MIRRMSGAILLIVGALLMIYRMPLVYELVGKTKTKLALFLGIDKLQIVVTLWLIVAAVAILVGVVFILSSLRREGAPSVE